MEKPSSGSWRHLFTAGGRREPEFIDGDDETHDGRNDADFPAEPPKGILDRLDEFKPPSLCRPLAQEDIENAIAEAMIDQGAALSREMMIEFDQDVLLG